MNAIEHELKLWQEALGQLNFQTGVLSLFHQPSLSQRARKQLSKLNSGLQIAKYLQNELKNRNNDEKEILDFLTSLTTPIHEIRHWHDYAGTTLGFEIFWIYIEYYSRTMNALKYLAQNNIAFNLPLKSTFYNQAADNYLNEFAEFKSRQTKLLHNKLFQVSDISSDIRKTKKNRGIMYLNDIPFCELDNNGRLKDIFTKDVPLTGISLFESSAVLTEVYAIFDMIGIEEADLYMKKRFEYPHLWIYSSVIKSLIMAHSNITIELMLTIISNSLIYPRRTNNKECNPVSRFITFRDELIVLKGPPKTLDDIGSWILGVIKKNGWSDNKQIAYEQIRFCETRIKLFEKIMDEESRDPDALEDYIIFYLKEHIKYLKKYGRNISFWASEYFYFDKHSDPPIQQITNDTQTKWVFNGDLHLRWFTLMNIIDQLFNVTKEQFCCPFKGSKICNFQKPDCGKFPLEMPPKHPECWYLVTSCEILAPNWNVL